MIFVQFGEKLDSIKVSAKISIFAAFKNSYLPN